ncbi:MAG TPA: glycosyl transferase family 2 [Flavobacteriales bacterium]|nr:glycosyl transferase family 2 [Flavobacteriales bacterium]
MVQNTKLKKVFYKFLEVIKGTDIVRNRKTWNTHRFVIFFFSVRGQKRIFNFFFKVFRFFWRSIFGGKQVDDQIYDKWLRKNTPKADDISRYKAEAEKFSHQPLISIVVPVYKPNLLFLEAAVNSVINQCYSNWELCLVDDASGQLELTEYLNKISLEDKRIRVKFRKENGHISACTNDAIDLASGTYIAFMDQDDVLSTDALYHVAKNINLYPAAEIFYSDEDKMGEDGTRRHPHFKPDYAPHNLLSRNYFGHLVTVSSEMLSQTGKLRLGFEGSQDYDLWLRIVEKAGQIIHIPRVLYHWRMHKDSTAGNEGAKNYAFENGIKALDEALKRRGIKGKAELLKDSPGVYRIRYELIKEDLISIVIPTKDNASVLGVCLKSVFEKSSYQNFEVLLVNNNSEQESTFDLLEKWKRKEPNRFRVLNQTYPFNFSKLMNAAAREARGAYLLLLNNDTEVLQEDWMEVMLAHAQRPETGAVGVKLLFPNDTIQHGGVVIGIQGLAGHTFVSAPRDEPGYFYYLKAVSDYSAVTAACLLVSKQQYFEVGGFDEELAVEYNDVDFCLKLVEKGYYNVFVPDVEMYHYESLTRGHPHANRKVYKRHKKEVKLYTTRWRKFIDNDPFYNPNLTRITTYFEPNIHG